MKPRILKVTVGVLASFAAAAFIFSSAVNPGSFMASNSSQVFGKLPIADAQTVSQSKDCPVAGWEWTTGSTPPGSGDWQEGKFYLTPPGPVQEGEANEVVAIADFSHCTLITGNKYPASLTFTDSNGKTYQVGLRDVDPANPTNTEIQWASLIGHDGNLLGGSNNLGTFTFAPTITINGSQFSTKSSLLNVVKQLCSFNLNFDVNGTSSLAVAGINQNFNLNLNLIKSSCNNPSGDTGVPYINIGYFVNNNSTPFAEINTFMGDSMNYSTTTSLSKLSAGNRASILVKVTGTFNGDEINDTQSTPVVICYNAPCVPSQGGNASTTTSGSGSGGSGNGGGSGSSGASATTVGLINPLGSNCSDLNCPIKKVANILFTFAIPIFAILILIGGYQLMTSSGNPESVSKGKKTILYSVVGFIVILLAGSIATLIVNIFGGS